MIILMNQIKLSPLHGSDSIASISLDLLRGLAAVLVLGGHLRSLFFVSYEKVLRPNIITNFFYFLTGLGHESVIIFFVLSGYLISSSVIRNIRNNQWSWRNYFINRLTRLYIVLVPAIILGALWDQLGINILHVESLYNGKMAESILNFSVIYMSTISTALGNLLFLQGIAVPSFGSNGALWSLAYEFWYYILYPSLLLTGLSVSQKRIGKSFLFGLLSLAIMFLVGKIIMVYFLIWLLGACAFILPKLNIKKNHIASLCLAGAIVLLFSALVISRFKIGNVDFFIGITVAILIYVLKSFYESQGGSHIILQKLSFVSPFSYTLYLLHTPFLVFIYGVAIRLGFTKWQPQGSTLVFGALIVLGILFYAWIISQVFEKNTGYIKGILLRRFGKKVIINKAISPRVNCQ